MEKLDLKDKKILYQLDLNSRQSLSKIGKKVKLPKNVVAYRINRLKQIGIIKNFYTVVDASKLGYISLRLYVAFQYTTPLIEKEIIDYFTKNKYTYWVGSREGEYDLTIITWVKNVNEFYSFWESALKKYRDNIQNEKLSLYVVLFHYRYSYLINDSKDRAKFEITGGGKEVSVDELDFQILKIIAPNARINITEIAEKLNSTPTIINYRIKKLVKFGIIQGFRVNIDFSKLGYHYFKVDVYLKDYNRRNEIMDYIKFNPNLIYINQTVGFADLEMEFHVESLEKLHEIIKDLVVKFSTVIKNCKYFNISKVHKLHYMPEE